MWYKHEFFKIATGILLVLTIIFLFIQIKDIFNLFYLFTGAVFSPLVIAGALYYILRPVRTYLESKKLSRLLSIFIIYLLLFTFLAIISTFIWPKISVQIAEFMSTPEEKFKEVENNLLDILNSFGFEPISQEQLRESLVAFFKTGISWFSANILSTLGSIAMIATLIVITPLLLFYLLKDDHKFSVGIQNVIPIKYTKLSLTILEDIDETLSRYISSQFLIACIVGALIYVGYTVIQLKYAFLLAIIALIFNLIPFAGPFISTIPAIFVGLSTSPLMVFKIILVVLIVHFLDISLISPRVIGSQLKIHPITVILLLIASIPLFGIWGVFLITPLYAALKVVVLDLTKYKVESEVKK